MTRNGPIETGAAASEEAGRRKGLILTGLGGCFLVVMMDNTILNVALQTIQRDLGASNSQLQWAVDAYILVYAALMFSAGVLADSHGRRRMLLAGLGVFTVASVLSALSSNPEQLIFWRAVMGLGGAVVPAATLAIIKASFPPGEHERAMGVWAALGGLSVAFGPILGGLLLERFWWGSVFLINVPLVLVFAVLIVIAVPESRAERRRRLDLGGVVLSALGTATLIYGVIRGGETNDWLSLDAAGAITAGVLLLVGLVLFERRQVDPALDLTLFRNAPFTAGTLSISLSFFALTGGTFLLVFYVQLVRGESPLELGLILLPVAFGSVAAALSSSAIAARRGARATVVLGLCLLLASLLALAAIGAGTELWILEVTLLAAGLGMGFVMATTTTLAMWAVDAEKSGVGAAINNTLRQIGAALGVAIMGSIYSVRYREEIGSSLGSLTPPLPPQASESLSSTLLAIERAGQESGNSGLAGAAGPLLVQAREAFVASMHTAVLVAAGVLAVGVAVAWRWLPGRQPALQRPPATTPPRPIPATAEGRTNGSAHSPTTTDRV